MNRVVFALTCVLSAGFGAAHAATFYTEFGCHGMSFTLGPGEYRPRLDLVTTSYTCHEYNHEGIRKSTPDSCTMNFDDKIHSVLVEPGEKAVVWQNYDARGRMWFAEFSGCTDFSDSWIRGKISSVRVDRK